METAILSARGQITIPKNIRKKLNLKSKSTVSLEVKDNAILIKPAIVIELRDFQDDMINDIINENQYKDENERKEILKKWNIKID